MFNEKDENFSVPSENESDFNATENYNGESNGETQSGYNNHYHSDYRFYNTPDREGDIAGDFSDSMRATTNNYAGNNYNNFQQTDNNQNNTSGKGKKIKKAKVKKPREHRFMKRTMRVCAAGIGFGVFAGLGLYVVSMVSGSGLGIVQTTSADLSAKVSALESEVASLTGQTVLTDNGTTISTVSSSTVVTDVTDVVEKAMPSIVSVTNNYTETSYSIFGQATSAEATAVGSGIIVGENDTELLILTNYHVIEDADSLSVQFIDESEVEAQVKGTDSDMDLAILAINLSDISSETMASISIATLGDSDALQVGEPAIAIGNALGYGQSVTTGVISAVNREVEIDGVTNEFIQTDAAINPGNSGGALLNINGEVIGINSSKIGATTVEGMGYAIPISSALPIIEELMTKETLTKVDDSQSSYLGIGGATVSSDQASMYSIPEGVYITQIYEGTPAEEYGLSKGDIITEFDGTTITSMEQLQELLEYYAAGTSVDITVMRISQMDYEAVTVTVVLGNKADAPTN